MEIIAFGNLAIMASEGALDPWLCVPTFRWVCPYRRDLTYYFINFPQIIAIDIICVNSKKVLGLCSPISPWGSPLGRPTSNSSLIFPTRQR